MQLKNNLENANWQIMSFVNRGKMETVRDHITHELREQQMKPQFKLIHVPPLATVHIDDELWANAVFDTKRTRKLFTEEKVLIPNLKQGKELLYRTVRHYTGETVEFCMIQQQIDDGVISIVEHPKSKLSTDEMQAALKAKGVPTKVFEWAEMSDEEAAFEAKVINNLYNKVCL